MHIQIRSLRWAPRPKEPRREKIGFYAYAKKDCEADQRLCFRYTGSTIPLLPKSEIASL